MLNVHWQPYHRIGGKDKDWFAELGPRFVKVVWMGTKTPYVGDVPWQAIYLYRDYGVESQHRHLLSTDPEELGRLHVEACLGASAYLAQNGFPKAQQLFESMNEPEVWASETPAKLARYLVAFLNGLHKHDLHGVVSNLGVGWPNNNGPDTPPVWTWFQPVANAMQPGDYLGAHEYWHNSGPRENWGWWAGRALKCPYKVPILITECGIDGGVKVHGSTESWQNIWPGLSLDQAAERFTNELWEYMALMREDPRVQGIFPFTYDCATDNMGHSKWAFFDQRPVALKQAILRKRAQVPMPAPKPFSWDAPPIPSPDPVPGPEPGKLAQGVDVSAWQALAVDWTGLKQADHDFAFMRLSVNFSLDVHIWRHLNQSEDSGLLRGVYHYLAAQYEGRRQARFFWSLWNDLDLELPAVVDIEDVDLTAAQIRAFIERFRELSGFWPMVYTSKSKWEQLAGKNATWAKDCLLWVAHYNVNKPALPDIWSTWEFWQIGAKDGPGDSKPIDRNVFNGTAAELRARYGGAAIPPAVPGPVQPPIQSPTGLEISYESGGPYIIGDYPVPGAALTLTDPWGNHQRVIAGEKPEFGRGGFLFNIYVVTDYSLQVESTSYRVPAKAGQTVWLSWSKHEEKG